MNIPFDIVKGKGPIIFDPLRTAEDVDQVREFVPEEFVPYVGEALTILRKEVCVSIISFAIILLVLFSCLSFWTMQMVDIESISCKSLLSG